jgi:hypothetical protein
MFDIQRQKNMVNSDYYNHDGAQYQYSNESHQANSKLCYNKVFRRLKMQDFEFDFFFFGWLFS